MNRLQLLFVAGSLALAGAIGVSVSSVNSTAPGSASALELAKKKKKKGQQRNKRHRPKVQKHTAKMKGVAESKQTLMSDKEKAAKMAEMLKASGVNPAAGATKPAAAESKAEKMKRLVEGGKKAIGR